MNLKPYYLPIVAIVSTILLEILAIKSGRLINFDGISYLRSADAFLMQDYQAAYAIYQWPFYSALIALVSYGLHVSLTMASYILNGLFQLMLTAALIKLIKQLGGNRRCQWFGLAIVLAHPYLNDYRSFVMCEFGYWAFFFVGLACFTVSLRKKQIIYGFLGGLALLLSVAFRIESLLFMVLLPLIFLANRRFTWQERIIYSHAAWLPLFISIILLLCLMLYYGQWDLSHMERFDHVINLASIIPTIRANVSSLVLDMKTNVLDYQAQHGASVIMIGGLLVLMLFEIIKVTNPFLFLISAYSAKRHFMPKNEGKRLCQFALLINLGILLYFVGTFTFLSGRYVMPISLLLLLWAPFAIEHFYQYFCVFPSGNLKYWYYPAIVCVFIGCFVYNISHWHYDKMFIRDAGQWTKRHIDQDKPLISNSAEYLFYSRGVIKTWDQSFNSDIQTLLDQANFEDMVAIKLSKKQALKVLPTLQDWKFLATFQNKRSDRLIIMQKSN